MTCSMILLELDHGRARRAAPERVEPARSGARPAEAQINFLDTVPITKRILSGRNTFFK